MAAPARRPSRRERPSKPPLSREAIVAAGLDVLRKEGLEALTMRRVAQALDTGPASLYVYVTNRQQLLELMLEAAMATFPLEPLDPPRWREQLKAVGRQMVRLMSVEYPGMASLAMTHIPTGPNALRIMEALLAMLRAGGMEDQAAAYAGDLLTTYVTAVAFEQSLAAREEPRPDSEEYVAEVARRFASLSAEDYPNMAALGPLMTRGDVDERFELGMDVLINGLLATPTADRLTAQPWAPG